MDVTRIDQIAIAVPDLDAALEFWQRAFGLEPEYRETVESDGVEEAMINVNGVYIQLLQATREDSPIARYLDRNGPGLHHIGFGVDSV
ncbi:MAG TPA: VOC family protein, partial [Nitriliruptorales bacterium]